MKYSKSYLAKWVASSLTILAVVSLPSEGLAKAASEPGPKAQSSKGERSGDDLAYIKARQSMLSGNYQEAMPYLEEALRQDPESARINHELADAYLRMSQFEKAEPLSRKAVEKEPNNIDFRATFAGILAAGKRYPEAKEQYIKIQELDPSNMKVPLLMGILDAEAGNFDESIKTLTKSIEGNAENYMAYFYRAKVYLEMENVEKAKGDLEKSLTLRPSFVEAGTALGMIHERLGDIDQAIATYSKIQGNGRFKKRLGQLYLSKNEFDKALQEFTEFEKVEPDDYSVKVKIGLIYFEVKKFEKAIDTFNAILKEQPDAGNVRFYLGVLYEEIKKPDLAIAQFKRVTFDSGFYKEAMLHVGFILRDQGRMDEGAKFAAGVLAAHKDIVEFYDMSASFHEAKKDYKKALGIIRDGLKKYAKDEKLLYFEGALLDKMGDKRKGIATMKRILEINGDNAHALNFLGYTYAELGENLDEAQTMVEKALTLRPNDGYIEDSLAWVLFKKGKLDEAQAKLEHAITLLPEEAIIYEHLGDIYRARQNPTKAIEMYRKSSQFAGRKKDKDAQKKVEAKLTAARAEERTPSTKQD